MSALIAMAIAALMLAGCGGVSVPPRQIDAAQIERQAQAFVEAMKPRRAGRPVIAIVALNESTETTDFLLPHAVLQRADVGDVHAVAVRRGRVSLYPTLQVEVAQNLSDFDEAYPAGADYVVVPAMDDANEPAISAWLQRQADRGARIIGVCAGALIVGRAGLLDGRRVVTHWHFRRTLIDRHPTAEYVPHQRYVLDRDVATTTGITASIPTMLALVEAIGGRDRARALADELGVESWTTAHDSSLFGLNVARMWNYTISAIAFWRDEDWSIDVSDGMDDVALALVADAWARTGHIRVAAAAAGPVKLRSGMMVVAQPADRDIPRVPRAVTLTPMQQLERTLCEIGERFGTGRLEAVMMELEYAGPVECSDESGVSDPTPPA